VGVDGPSLHRLQVNADSFSIRYWDLPYINYNYSYVDLATNKYRYHTLAYDRLGFGNSSHANINAQQYQFFRPPFFDPQILQYAEATKQPVALGEILTLGGLPAMSPFAGPVLCNHWGNVPLLSWFPIRLVLPLSLLLLLRCGSRR